MNLSGIESFRSPKSKDILWWLIYTLVSVLLFVWNVPGTIGLRNSLLGFLLVSIGALRLFDHSFVARSKLNSGPLIWLILLTIWMLLTIVQWGAEPKLSLNEFRGQWLMALGSGIIGFQLAKTAAEESLKHLDALIKIIFWSLLSQVMLHDVLSVIYWMSTNQIPFRQAPVLYLPEIFYALSNGRPISEGFTGHSGDKFSYVSNMLAGLVVAELVQRMLLKSSWLRISWQVLFLSLGAVLLCTYLLQFRNGSVGLLLLISFASFMVLVRKVRSWPLQKGVAVSGLVVGLLTVLSVVLYESDDRWQTLAETIPIALDTKTHHAWRHEMPYPKLSSGEQVDSSNYERIAWLKEGLVLTMDQPLGTGYNRNAFGDGIDRKYLMNGMYRGGHSHSGLVDFTIANGIPGLFLWLAFLASLFYSGWTVFLRNRIGLGLTLMFLVSGFLSRSIVDSNIRDHMLQQFMFLALFFSYCVRSAGMVKVGPND